jgi:hypothetical protein
MKGVPFATSDTFSKKCGVRFLLYLKTSEQIYVLSIAEEL